MKSISLVGNPNVGKTTLFNILTDENEHTGNWSGKTVGVITGQFEYLNEEYTVYDLPGTYSLDKSSIEEEVTINYLQNNKDDITFVFVDGTNLSRGLFLFFEVKRHKEKVKILITMEDVLQKNDINIDINRLEEILKSDVILVSLKNVKDKDEILEIILQESKHEGYIIDEFNDLNFEQRVSKTHQICSNINDEVVDKIYEMSNFDKKMDKLLFNKFTGRITLFLMATFVLWLSIFFSNIFQTFFYNIFNDIIVNTHIIFEWFKIPHIIDEVLISGGLSTSLFVASVMIPPMLIFFPLFTAIEEVGLIPRIAFNLDGFFSKFNCNGKNTISMMLGFGCNCVGVTSTRILESEKSRKIAIMVNNFIPCNGRLPMIFLLVLTFLSNNILSALLIILIFLIINILISLSISLLLSRIYKNQEQSFIYELPSYKKPSLRNVLKVSIIDKAFYVLGKSITFSFFAGIVLYIFKNINFDGNNILFILSEFLNPLGSMMGLSGIILLAFIIGFSANEIVLPIVFMLYSNQSLFIGGSTFSINNVGITYITAICMIVFSLNHYPCIASLSTIKKETNSTQFALLCAIVPTVIGVCLCILTNFILQNLQNLLF